MKKLIPSVETGQVQYLLVLLSIRLRIDGILGKMNGTVYGGQVSWWLVPRCPIVHSLSSEGWQRDNR
jgi:hypothetical protein